MDVHPPTDSTVMYENVLNHALLKMPMMQRMQMLPMLLPVAT